MIATKYWSSLKGEIARAIRENNKGEIIGASLQSVLYSIINSVGDFAYYFFVELVFFFKYKTDICLIGIH